MGEQPNGTPLLLSLGRTSIILLGKLRFADREVLKTFNEMSYIALPACISLSLVVNKDETSVTMILTNSLRVYETYERFLKYPCNDANACENCRDINRPIDAIIESA